MKTRVLVAGTRSFGIACTKELLELPGVTVVGVVAPHDDSLAAWAAHKGLLVGNTVTEAIVRDARTDVILGAHCHDYIGKASRAAARYGAVIGHPSLLPRHRGKSSVEWTVRMGDAVTGFTWFVADSGVDTGPIVTQAHAHVPPGADASTLWRERLFPLGLALLERAVDPDRIASARPQDVRVATWEPALDNVPNLHRTELPELSDRPHTGSAPLTAVR